MRLLHLTTAYFPRVGGVPSEIRNIAHNTSDVYEHHLLCGINGESKETWQGKKITTGVDNSDERLTVHRFKGSLLTGEMQDFLKSFDHDVLVCYGWSSSIGDVQPDKKILVRLQRGQEVGNQDRISRLWVYSERIKKLVKAPSDKVSVLPILVNTDLFKANDKVFYRLIYAGRFAKEKKIIELIDIFKRLYEENNLYSLKLVGKSDNTSYQVQINKALDKLDEETRNAISFHLAESEEELAKFYEDSDIFILNSGYETFGSSALEAISSGLAVVTTARGGIEDWAKDYVMFVDGEKGIEEGIKNPCFPFRRRGLYEKFISELSWKKNKDRFIEMIERTMVS